MPDDRYRFPPIGDYGLIGDTRSAALVNRLGGVDWLCWPRFDSAALFCALLDRERGGRCEFVASAGTLAPAGRRYVPGTLLLETTIAQRGPDGREVGRFTVTDAMTVRRKPLDDADRPQSPADDVDLIADGRLVRSVRCDGGAIDVELLVWPTFDFAQAARASALCDGTRARLRAGDDGPGFAVDASGPLAVDPARGAVSLRLRLSAGERAWIVLSDAAIDGHAPVTAGAAVDRLLDATRAYWQQWDAQTTYDGPQRDAVARSVLTLKAMTCSETGAIVAAPTLGLPEVIGSARNYDYRFTWLRDGGFTTRAFLMTGHQREARAYLRFLSTASTDEGRAVPVLLTLDGAVPPVTERTLDHLSGYADSRPIVVGNLAAAQQQHDVFGEAMNGLYAYWTMTGVLPHDDDAAGLEHLRRVVRNLVDCVTREWRKPDHGVWEVRDGKRHFVHSKAMCWVAIDRAIKLAEPLGLREHVPEWTTLAATIRADYLARGWSERLGAYAQSYDGDVLDAAPLRVALFGAFDDGDDRLRRTVDAIRARLGAPGAPDLIYRYRADDGIAGDEGTFTSCAFWVMNTLAMTGRLAEARAMFDRLIGRANDLGLFAEEIDPHTGGQLGNVPQAFTHMCVVNGAQRLLTAEREASGASVDEPV